MYCSSCGTPIVQGGLAYCNHCGAKLAGTQNQVSVHTDYGSDSLIWAIVGVFVGGLGVLIGLLAVMKKELQFNVDVLMFFSVLTFALIMAIDAVLLWMLFSRHRAATRAREVSEQRATKELDAAPARLLAEPIPLPSVTEQTTRSFEPSIANRK